MSLSNFISKYYYRSESNNRSEMLTPCSRQQNKNRGNGNRINSPHCRELFNIVFFSYELKKKLYHQVILTCEFNNQSIFRKTFFT